MPEGPVSSRARCRRPLRRRADSFSHCSICHGSNLPDIAAKLTKYLTQLRLHLVEGARGVDQPKSRGFVSGPRQKHPPHTLEKRELLALETIELAAAASGNKARPGRSSPCTQVPSSAIRAAATPRPPP